MIEVRGGDLWFEDRRVAELADELGTPFFLFSERALEENYQRFRRAFAEPYPKIRIDYCVKANNEIAILRRLRGLGASAEIAAAHELTLIEKAGFSPEHTVYDSPYKPPPEIEITLERGIRAFYADGEDDLRRINDAAGRLGRRARVALRVNLIRSHFLRAPTEQLLKKFGFSAESVPQVLSDSERYRHVEFIGLSTHLGSQQISPAPYLRAVDSLFELAGLMERNGRRVSEISLGGGFPSHTLQRVTVPDLILSRFGGLFRRRGTRSPAPIEAFGEQIGQRFADLARSLEEEPTLALQPGRSLVGDAAVVVARVAALKGRWVFLDISAMSLPESLFFARRRMLSASRAEEPATTRYDVAGRGLNTADNLGLGVALPRLEVGEVVVLLDAGAYSLSRANRYTVLTPPAYLLDSSGELILIRRKETLDDVIAPMVL